MKYKILQENVQLGTHQFLIDTTNDLINLPKEPGSTVLVVNTKDIYVCNNAKEWIKL